MSAQIFEFSGNGLQPLTTQGLQIGQRVRQAHKGKAGVIVDEDQVGYDVIFPDGDHAYHQRLDQLSPFTRITLLEGIADADEISHLKLTRDQKQEADRLAQVEAAKQQTAEFEKYVEDLQRNYPSAIRRGTGLSEHARAAKNLKSELHLAFPGIKFAVRSSSFSGGDSIDVRWTLGPTSKEVGAIANKYQEGDFNGMIDLYENDRSAYGEAIDKVLGRAKYVSEARNFPDGLYEQIGRGLCALQHVEYDGPYTRFLFGQNDRYDLQSHVTQVLSRTSFAAGESYLNVETVPFEERDSGNDWCRIIKTAPTTKPARKKKDRSS
jgi:hypothetical protein